jgi:hypothetical protein
MFLLDPEFAFNFLIPGWALTQGDKAEILRGLLFLRVRDKGNRE